MPPFAQLEPSCERRAARGDQDERQFADVKNLTDHRAPG
jgi:hypothetical protein